MHSATTPDTQPSLFSGQPAQERDGFPAETPLFAYAQVLLQLEHPGLASRTFTYKIPDDLQGNIQVGVPVLVPFGSMQPQLGYVVGLTDDYHHTQKAKAIVELIDETPLFDAAYFEMLQYVAQYYATPIHQVMSCALPSNLVQKTKKEIQLNLDRIESIAFFKLPAFEQQLVNILKAQPKSLSPQQFSKLVKVDRKSLNVALNRLKQEQFISVVQAQDGVTKEKTERILLPKPADETTLETLTAKQKTVLELLQIQDEWKEKEFIEHAKTTREMIQKLEKAGVVTVDERPIFRDPLSYFKHMHEKHVAPLYEAQEEAVQSVMNASDENPSEPFVLYGVTGSGKTEVYLHITQRMLAEGKSILLMVPEIALTSQLAKRFIAFFGRENIALWHSHLSAGEKADTWRKLARGDLRIVIAARSGIWAPLKNLGVIILDEEHEGSFKQDAPVPRYHARTVAEYRVRQHNAKLVLGSATPDIGTFFNAQESNRLLRLPERFGGRPMAKVIVVDMKQERREGLKGNLSKTLKAELQKNLVQEEQSIILINRRGFYTTLQCGHCEHIITCNECDVSLTFHKTVRQVRCHYCGYQDVAPQFCPICASHAIHQTGVGTQRVEEELQKAFPEARLLRMDTDTLSGKNSHHEIYQKFANGEADILIGTQMVAKGLDIANVTLVGVIAADSSFSLPDFKAAERGFQLLTQVAGRAGRGTKPGRVVFQSVLSDLMDNHHPVIRYASAQDYKGFYEHELAERRIFQYPPFSQLFRMILSAESEKTVHQFALATAAHLKQQLQNAGIADKVFIVGPASCVIPRIQNRYRFHIMLKNMAGETGHQLITHFYQNVPPPEGIHFHLDVDALSLL